MPRSVRQALIAALIALHATVTVCGTGLHALPGLGHDSGLRPLAKNDHSHGPGRSSHEAADDCAVCHFLAQGQVSSDLACGVTAWLTAVAVPAAASSVDLATPHSPAIPRGPPSSPRA